MRKPSPYKTRLPSHAADFEGPHLCGSHKANHSFSKAICKLTMSLHVYYVTYRVIISSVLRLNLITAVFDHVLFSSEPEPKRTSRHSIARFIVSCILSYQLLSRYPNHSILKHEGFLSLGGHGHSLRIWDFRAKIGLFVLKVVSSGLLL